MMDVVEIPPRPPLGKGGEHPSPCAEGFLPFAKGGQEGFDAVTQPEVGKIPPSPHFSKGGEQQAVFEGFLPLKKGGQEGFNPAWGTPCA